MSRLFERLSALREAALPVAQLPTPDEALMEFQAKLDDLIGVALDNGCRISDLVLQLEVERTNLVELHRDETMGFLGDWPEDGDGGEEEGGELG